MSIHNKQIISILMESPFYLSLSLKERHSLLARIAENYPSLVKSESEETVREMRQSGQE